ncbi:hypothetical protein [Halorubrum tibetense]|uniref:Prepilin type IV endopeptidase peptidase domain-containing protein n=1 Tax=Halorubrum tibetense TaxID=175631 RepID=A0ABD5S8Q8_9EURY
MREPFDPSFEFDLDTVAWVVVTMTLLCATVVFVFDRPAWNLPAAFLAGGVAAARGGFYDAAANNGFVGVLVGLGPMAAMFYVYRFGGIPSLDANPDLLFLTSVGVGADMIAYAPMMVIFGYLGGVAVDRIRRRTRPPVGYRRRERGQTVRRSGESSR